MTEEMTSIQKLIEFLYSIGLPPMRILRGLIALLVIGAIVGALYVFNFDSLQSAKRPDDDTESEVDHDRPTYEFDLTLDQQIDELTFFDSQQESYVVVYGNLQKQNETINKLRQRSGITPEQVNKLDSIELRNLQTLLLRTMQSGVSAEHERKAFQDFANKLVSEGSDERKDLAQFALVRTAVGVFALKPNEDNGGLLIDALNQQESCFVSSISRAETLLALLLKCRDENPANKVVNTCVDSIGKVFANSTDADVQVLAKKVSEFSLFADLNVSTLEKRIRYQDRNALNDLDKALRVLEANPDVEISKWKILMRCYEASLSIGRINDFETGRRIIGELVANLPNSDQRKAQLVELLDRQKNRAQQFGQPIDLTGVTLNEKPINQTAGNYSVLILMDRSQRSVNMMQELASFQTESGRTFRPIIAFEDEFTQQDIEKVNSIPTWIFVANDDTAQKYFASFPPDFFPYSLLIDRGGNVVAGNLSLVQVANRIATLDRKKKNAANLLIDQ